MAKKIVFIHGMFMTPSCWEIWRVRFEENGYSTVAPAWPGRDRPVPELKRQHPDAKLGQLGLAQVVSVYEDVVRQMSEPPILVGHSMGGLIVQLLLAKGLGAKGVAIHSAPPQGIFVPSWTFLKSNWPVINPLVKASVPLLMTPEQFNYSWVHTLDPLEQQGAYDAYLVPESRYVGRDSTSSVASVDFSKKTAPLLLTAGSSDRIIPAALNHKNFEAYAKNSSKTEFKEFEGRTHFVLGQPQWKEVADFIQKWVEAD